MTLTSVALRNLWRRKGKTLFLLLTLMIITSIIITLNTLAVFLQEDLNRSLSEYGANIIITPRSEHFALSYGGLSVPRVSYDIKTLENETLSKIRKAEKSIRGIAPKVIGSAQEKGKRYLVIGVDFPSELNMKPWWKVQGKLPQANEVVLGSTLAARENLHIGSKVQLNNREYLVTGIMQETGGSEDKVIFTDIPTARSLTGMTREWSLIEINAAEPEKTLSILTELLPEAKVALISQLVEGSKETVERFANFAKTVSLLLVFIGVLIVFVSISGSINTRISELGILQALGFRPKHILSLLIREISILCLLGGALGYGLGLLLPSVLGPLAFSKTIPLSFHPWQSLYFLGELESACLLAVSYPAWKASRLNALKALSYI